MRGVLPLNGSAITDAETAVGWRPRERKEWLARCPVYSVPKQASRSPPLPQQWRSHVHRCQREKQELTIPTYITVLPPVRRLNNDGKVDLVVADDSTPNYLYLNKGNETFEDDSYTSGYALNENGRETASMGIAVGDYRNNGLLDLYNTVFSDDYNPLYRNDGNANLRTSLPARHCRGHDSLSRLGNRLRRLRQRGWKDLFVANGHLYPEVDNSGWGTTFRQRPLLFHNLKGEKFALIPPVRGTGLTLPDKPGERLSATSSVGKMDVVINQVDDVPVLLRNDNPDKNHWVVLELIGGPKSPRDAVELPSMSTLAACARERPCSAAGV